MINIIQSRENKIIKTVRSLSRKKGREKCGLYFAEGLRIVRDSVAHISDEVEFLLASQTFFNNNKDFIKTLDSTGKIVYITEDKYFNEVCDTETPQGIASIIKIPDKKIIDLSCDYILILDGISEPGNMGTIIRTAEAAGVKQICLINNCTDIYNPKTVRSSMGSVFRMSFADIILDDIENLKNSGFTVAATALTNSVSIEDANIKGKRAIVIGNEAHGVSDAVIDISDISVRINMCGEIESLNAAVAAGIAMYILKPSMEM